MGVMRFLVPDVERITDSFLEDVYIASIEGVPWRCFAERTEDGFQVRRKIDESGCLYAMWRMSDGGQMLLSTASLRVRERPYLLAVELARGTLNRLRNQTAAWRQAGLDIPQQVVDQIAAAAAPFCVAATNQHDLEKASEAAEQTIRESLHGCDLLLQTYVEQLEEARNERPKPTLMFGTALRRPVLEGDAAKAIKSTFNIVSIEPNWAECEPVTGDYEWLAVDETADWARQHHFRLMVGPVLSFDSAALPDWLVLWEDDFQALHSYVVTWVREVVERFAGEVHLWNLSARLNSGRVLTLTDEQRLKLTVSALETLRQVDPRTPLIISFDQPWAEYMTHTNTDVAPLHYADALARADLGVGGLGLEIDWGYRPGGTMPRNPLELSQLLDHWSMLGLPLVVFLTTPSSLQHDPRASHKISPLPGTPIADWDVQQQSDLATRLAEICWCKQSVQGIVWNSTFDAKPHKFPNAGLFDERTKPKPILESLGKVKRRFLA